jgi:hypothetical protein
LGLNKIKAPSSLWAGLIGSKNKAVIASAAKQSVKFTKAILAKINAMWLEYKIKDNIVNLTDCFAALAMTALFLARINPAQRGLGGF